MEDFQIRTASNADRGAAVALVKKVLPAYGMRYEIDDNDADLEDIEGGYIARGGTFEVLVDASGAVRGTFGFEPIGGGACRLRKMYLSPELKGRGLGLRMLQRAVERARELGFNRMELETCAVLKEAIKLYTRFGFKRTAGAKQCSSRCDQSYALDL